MADVSWGHGTVADATQSIDLLDPLHVALSPSSAQINAGEEAQIVATAYYRDGSTRDVTSLGAWSTDDTSIAVVTKAGLVSALGVGEASISFVYGTTIARVSVEVLTESPQFIDDDWWWAVIA